MNQQDDPLDLDAQAKAKQKDREAAARAVHIEQDDTRWLMSTKRGRRIIWRLLEVSGVYRLSFDRDAMSMAFNEGNRNFGNQLLAEITRLCPERYLEMLKEHKQHARPDDKRSD